MAEINFERLAIYTNGIIMPETFSKLYKKEETTKQFETKITTNSHHPFATFLAKDRKNTEIKQGDFLILRALKENKKFEFITKIGRWGRFSIPKEVIKRLEIKNHEKTIFEIVKEDERAEVKEDFIDFAEIGTKVFYRAEDFVTIYKSYGTPITLPRIIKISPELIELCFLIHGDGSYKEKLYFVNKNPGLHRFVIDRFEKIFKLPKDIWRARLLINSEYKPELAKEYWKKALNLKEEQFYPSISKSILKTSNFGNIRIVIDNLIVAEVFRFVFSKLMDLDEYLSLHAVNGLLCAEGGARNEVGLHKITLSFNQKEKKMFQELLNKIRINEISKIYENRMFIIEKWENLYKFFKLFFSNDIIPFDKHNIRCENALKGFLKHSFTKTMEKYLKILNVKDSFDIKEIMKEMGHRHSSIYKTLIKEQYKKFVKFDGKGVNRNPFKISTTDEGKEFLMLVNKIREVYNEKSRLG